MPHHARRQPAVAGPGSDRHRRRCADAGAQGRRRPPRDAPERRFAAQRADALLDHDPHLGPFLEIPGKDNGFEIEGLAVNGDRLLLGLRGPVLRGWALLLEIAVETQHDELRPHSPGTDRAEAFCALPESLAGGSPAWLVLYDAPSPARREGELVVYGDLLRRD